MSARKNTSPVSMASSPHATSNQPLRFRGTLIFRLFFLAVASFVLWGICFGFPSLGANTFTQTITTLISLVCLFGVWSLAQTFFRSVVLTGRTYGGINRTPWLRFRAISQHAIYATTTYDVIALNIAALGVTVAYGGLFGWQHTVPCIALIIIGNIESVDEFLQPPSVFLLGNSSPQLLELQHGIKRAIAPQRVVSLLNPLVESHVSFPDQVPDLLRTSDDGRWRHVVMEIVEIVPIVVLDCRADTDPVRFEIGHIFSTRQLYKVLFLTEDGTLTRHLVEAASSVVGHQQLAEFGKLQTVTEEQLPMVLKYLTDDHRRIPTPEHPLDARLESSSLKQEMSRLPGIGRRIQGAVSTAVQVVVFVSLAWVFGWWWNHTPGYLIPAIFAICTCILSLLTLKDVRSKYAAIETKTEDQSRRIRNQMLKTSMQAGAVVISNVAAITYALFLR